MGRDYFTALLPSIGMQYVGGPMLTQGKSWFVRPGNGSDGYKGNRPDRAFKTLYNAGAGSAGALYAATANQNDVVYMLAESNTAASTTDYQSHTTTAALSWSKDMVHLVGVNSGNAISQRSRIALLSTFDTAIPMVDWSANGCLCANIQFFQGVAGTNPTGCVKVSGSRNRFVNCHFAGIGNDANDIAGAYSLWITGAENVFENCVIGLDTIDRGSVDSNYEIILGTGCARTLFKNCIILSRLQHSTYHPQVFSAGAAVLGDPSFVEFNNCRFINTSTNYGYAQTDVFKFTSVLTAGYVLVTGDSTKVNATNWGSTGTGSGRLLIHVKGTDTAKTDGGAYQIAS